VFMCAQGPFYCGVGVESAYGRELAEAHMEACIKVHYYSRYSDTCYDTGYSGCHCDALHLASLGTSSKGPCAWRPGSQVPLVLSAPVPDTSVPNAPYALDPLPWCAVRAD